MILVVFCICILIEMSSLYHFQKMAKSGQRPPPWLCKITDYNRWFKKKDRLLPSSSTSQISNDRLSSYSAPKLEGSYWTANSNGIMRARSNEHLSGTPNKIKKKNLVKNFIANEYGFWSEKNYFFRKDHYKRWQYLIKELKAKTDEEMFAVWNF